MKKIFILAVLFQFFICFAGNLPEVETDSLNQKIIDNELGKLWFTFSSASAPIQGEYGEYDIALTINSSDK
jgi:hypothetical protein